MPNTVRRPAFGYAIGLLAAASFGANGSVISILLMHDTLSPAQLTMMRTLVTAAITGVILLFTDRSAFRITRRQFGLLVVLGVAGVAMLQLFYALAVSRIDVGIALLFEYLAVPAVALIALIFFKEFVRTRIWVSIALVIVGLAVVAQVWNSTLDPLGVIYASIAAASYVVYFLLGERALTSMSVLGMVFWAMLVSTVFWGIFSEWWMIDLSHIVEPISLEGNLSDVFVPYWIPLAWALVVGSFVSFILSFVSLKHLKSTSAGIIASSEVIFAFVVAWLWLNETLTTVQLLGAAIVAVGIVLAQTARPGKVVDLDLATSEHADQHPQSGDATSR
jgi:drug/metabolite transporter (DMT)-like permease